MQLKTLLIRALNLLLFHLRVVDLGIPFAHRTHAWVIRNTRLVHQVLTALLAGFSDATTSMLFLAALFPIRSVLCYSFSGFLALIFGGWLFQYLAISFPRRIIPFSLTRVLSLKSSARGVAVYVS